ncbi:MAG: type II secretion system F family protein [Christensenellales bacterium]
MQILLLTISVSLFAFFVTIVILSLGTESRSVVKRRLQAIAGKEEQNRPAKQQKTQKRHKISVSGVFAEEILSAGIRMRPEEFLVFWLLAAVVPSGVILLAGGHVITILALSVMGLLIPPFLVIRAKKKRMILFEKQLGDALLLMGNCLRSGLSFQQAMINIAKEMPDPIAREFSRTVREIQLGNSMDSALNNMVQRIQSTDLMLMVSAVQIQRQVGGNLLEILDNISVTIKERLKLKDDIRVMTASGRISSVVVGMIPVFIAGALMLINPAYIQTFFETSMGIVMLITAAVMEVMGFLVIKKIVTIKY